MVKKKHRSHAGKTKKPASHSASGGPPAPLPDPPRAGVPSPLPEPVPGDPTQVGFPDRVYLLASVIFQNTHLEKPAAHRLVSYGEGRGLPLPEVKDVKLRTAYELAFNTLKYQELLEDIVTDSCLCLAQPLPVDQMSLAAVMLYDFQDRKFLPRDGPGEEEEFIPEVRDVETYLLRFKTKLAASLARCRIKHHLPSIDCILPESVKMKHRRSSSLPLYTWVNTLKSSLDEVQRVLRSAGLSAVGSIGQLEGQTFCRDPLCEDVLVFPSQLWAELSSTELLREHKLITQDRSCSLASHAAVSSLPQGEGDVLMAGSFSGLSVSHAAGLLAGRHRAGDQHGAPTTVYACVGGHTPTQREELQQVAARLGCRNVKFIPEVFQSLDVGDKRLERVCVVLVTPRCSMTALSDPVEFILQENGETELLQDLSHGSIAQSKLEALVAQQRKDIDHALRFPQVSAVVYSTCSSHPEENQEVVSGALQRARAQAERRGEAKAAGFRPSTFPFCSAERPEGPEEPDAFFTLKPSEQSNGCFLALLVREPERVVKESPREVLARANAKGLLDRIGAARPTRREQQGPAGGLIKAPHARASQRQNGLSVQARNPEPQGSDGAARCSQELANRRPFAQGKSRTWSFQSSKIWVPSSSPHPHQDTTAASSKPDTSSPPPQPVISVLNPAPLQPVPPPAARVVRPRRVQQEVLRPVVLALPPIHFPACFPALPARVRFGPAGGRGRWRSPAQTAARPPKDALVRSWPLF